VHVLLDDDVAGQAAFRAAEAEGIIDASGVNFTRVGGKKEAELEDLYIESVYVQIIRSETGLDWPSKGPDISKKWGYRLKNLLRQAGKPTDDGAIQIPPARGGIVIAG
jgi:hypothetical protein